MQQQCAKGVDDVMKAVESGTNAPDSIALHHSNEIINAHKACLSVADEKVSLALKTYDLVWWRWSSLQNSKSSLISNSSCQVLLMGILTTCSSILYSCSSVVLEYFCRQIICLVGFETTFMIQELGFVWL
jgi:hypothetical protein